VDDVIGTQQHFDAATLATGLATLAAFERQTRLENAQFDLDPALVDDHAGQENALPDESRRQSGSLAGGTPDRAYPIAEWSRQP
jgi:hypothetical protein